MWYYISGALIALWFIGGTYKHIRGRGKIICMAEENCTGCKQCLRKCKRSVLQAVTDGNGKMRVVVEKPNHCTACGDCLSGCKFNALKLITKK